MKQEKKYEHALYMMHRECIRYGMRVCSLIDMITIGAGEEMISLQKRLVKDSEREMHRWYAEESHLFRELNLPDWKSEDMDDAIKPFDDEYRQSYVLDALIEEKKAQVEEQMQNLIKADKKDKSEEEKEEEIRDAWELTGGHIGKTAQRIGMSDDYVRRRLIKYGLYTPKMISNQHHARK